MWPEFTRSLTRLLAPSDAFSTGISLELALGSIQSRLSYTRSSYYNLSLSLELRSCQTRNPLISSSFLQRVTKSFFLIASLAALLICRWIILLGSRVLASAATLSSRPQLSQVPTSGSSSSRQLPLPHSTKLHGSQCQHIFLLIQALARWVRAPRISGGE